LKQALAMVKTKYKFEIKVEIFILAAVVAPSWVKNVDHTT